MIEAQNAKYALMLPPISIAGGASATTIELDTIGFDYLEVLFLSGLIPATGFSTIKLQESDVSGSGQTDIPGAAFTALVDGDDNKILGCFMDLTKRKRYITLAAANGATNASLAASLARLSRAEQMPNTAARRGLKEQLFV